MSQWLVYITRGNVSVACITKHICTYLKDKKNKNYTQNLTFFINKYTYLKFD